MLKHKIRKSRKNILSLLEAVTQEEAEKGEAKETGRSSKKEKTGQSVMTSCKDRPSTVNFVLYVNPSLKWMFLFGFLRFSKYRSVAFQVH